MTSKKETVGECHKKALADHTNYDSREVGEHLTKDILENIWECVDRNKQFLDVDQFCVVQLLCDDCFVNNVKRIKYYAWPFLPNPRPRQTVFLYDRRSEKVRRIWSLPSAPTMEWLYQTLVVPAEWRCVQRWSKLFYDSMWPVQKQKQFFDGIRKDAQINMLSEGEHVDMMQKLSGEKTDVLKDQIDTIAPEAFDFDKALGNEFVAPK